MVKKVQLRPFNPINKSLRLNVELQIEDNCLTLTYDLYDPENLILIPYPESPTTRVIGLWESTCFELFIREKREDHYFEFNFSFKEKWNCFYFPKPNAHLTEWPTDLLPSISRLTPHQLEVNIPLSIFKKGFWQPGRMQLGISAVLEDLQGDLSYWALAHPDNKPNFHHFDSFLINL